MKGDRRGGRAGFTLVELMVALTGGLFISLAVFALARDSGRFYQRESRVANATVGALLGFERLRTDIARAGFLSSPNVNQDPTVCRSADRTVWPSNLRNLASIQVKGPATTTPILAANGRTPPEILLAGAYTSADSFTCKIPGIAATTTFNLERNQPALLRLGNGASPDTTTMLGAFPPNRGLRIVQGDKVFYGQIISAVGGAAPSVTINSQPQVPEFGSGGECGLKKIGSGTGQPTINVVNFIHYDLRNMNNAQTAEGRNTYASLYSASAAAPGEATRTELVRVEQDVTGEPIANTEEVVAEYAVDLNLRITAVSAIVGCCDPSLSVYGQESAQFAAFTGPTFNAASLPQRIRSVRVRLGVRSREPDRANTVASNANAGLFRFNLGVGGAGTSDSFARVRTFQADVALQNQADALW